MTKLITIEVPDDYLTESTVNGVVYQWDSDNMPNAAKLYVWEYGGQRTVNDRCGGADKTPEDKAKIASDMVTRLTSADFTARAPRGESDPLASYIRNIIRLAAKQANGEVWKAYKAEKESDKRNAMLDALFAKQDEAKQAAIREQAAKDKTAADAERAKREADAAKVGKGIDLTI